MPAVDPGMLRLCARCPELASGSACLGAGLRGLAHLAGGNRGTPCESTLTEARQPDARRVPVTRLKRRVRRGPPPGPRVARSLPRQPDRPRREAGARSAGARAFLLFASGPKAAAGPGAASGALPST